MKVKFASMELSLSDVQLGGNMHNGTMKKMSIACENISLR